jgi:hypothetical protein
MNQLLNGIAWRDEIEAVEPEPPRRLSSPARFPFYGISPGDSRIADLVVDRPSDGDRDDHGGGRLHVGSVVRLKLPLIGWRNAQVQWIRSAQLGCRLLVPLTENELRAAIAASPLIASDFPGLADQVSPSEPIATTDEPHRIMRIVKAADVPKNHGVDLAAIASLVPVILAWIALYALSL